LRCATSGMADEIVRDMPSAVLAPFRPDRFAAATA
jgi:hypothetical protein